MPRHRHVAGVRAFWMGHIVLAAPVVHPTCRRYFAQMAPTALLAGDGSAQAIRDALPDNPYEELRQLEDAREQAPPRRRAERLAQGGSTTSWRRRSKRR